MCKMVVSILKPGDKGREKVKTLTQTQGICQLANLMVSISPSAQALSWMKASALNTMQEKGQASL